ncbi:pyridine nucleotide-disulfide oxidoreductase domain-containing protein 2-like [Clavelina lepadiformis]|uniref:pyridine nucleotide-disulfide oxidoreductase domain-containing protein 2-like n=1 Tax=Clavelina lepadiformis TaxID=159417 RepID=UPI0040430925
MIWSTARKSGHNIFHHKITLKKCVQSWYNRHLSTVVTNPEHIKSEYDVIVIGAGHNGLTSAAYLAKHGLSVAVFERRHIVGGAAVTEEIIPGYKFSRASYVLSLLRPLIIKELNLKKYGLEVFLRSTAAFTPMLDDGFYGGKPPYLMLSSDPKLTYNEISKFSENDAKAYFPYEDAMSRISAAIKPILDNSPPVTSSSLFESLHSSLPLLKSIRQLGADVGSFYELFTAPISKILNRVFESEPLKATLATDGVIGAMLTPDTPGSGYVLLHHVIGECNNVQGSWGYVKGGMGSVSNAIASSACDKGAQIFVSQPVKQICVENESCTGVVLEDGQEIKSKMVLSNATPHVTFEKLIAKEKFVKHSDFLQHVSKFDYTSPVTKINVAVNKLPNFLACPNKPGNEVGEQHKGTIHLNCEKMSYLNDAFDDAQKGIPSTRPMIEMCIPSSIDPTLAPPGHHVISLFTQYTPFYLNGDQKWTENDKANYASTVFSRIDDYAPGFQESIVGVDILTPSDLEEVIGLTGGNIFHGAMSLDQLFISRPSPLLPSCESPFRGLYLCGSGAHPGGGVMGSCGRLAALTALKKK